MTEMVRLHASGPVVRRVQRELQQLGFHLAADGQFGHVTDAAVRRFQRKRALVPDGIVGPDTSQALGVPATGGSARPAEDRSSGGAGSAALKQDPAKTGAALSALAAKVGNAVVPHATQALYVEPTPGSPQPVRSLSMSKQGQDWLSAHESEKGVSNHLYWPTGASGVTLGAGYDMRERSAASIQADMLSIGLSASQAATASGGAGLKDQQAASFARAHRADISLTSQQETALLVLILPKYEGLVKKYVTIDLLQCQFDALVSVAYNPGGSFAVVAQQINAGQTAAAMALIKKRVYSGGKVLAALVRRRNDEVNCYLYGKYETT